MNGRPGPAGAIVAAAALAAAGGLGLVPAGAGRAAPPVEPLAARIAAIASRSSGTVGAAVVHVESGARVSVHGDRRFPMFSTYKVPIALQILRRVEQGSVRLDQEVEVTAADLRLGASRIAEQHPRGGVRMRVSELLEAMLVVSDNTAADLLLRLAGGAPAVTARLREIGIEDVRVDRGEGEIAFGYYGVRDAPPSAEWTLAKLRAAVERVPAAAKEQAALAFAADPRDTATPNAMADLLVRIAQGRAADAAGTARLLETMAACASGAARLPGQLPVGTVVAHKTGTGPSTAGVLAGVNDVGLVTLPGGRGRLAVAVFIQGAEGSIASAEATIAAIARAAYDHWTAPSTADR
jgi:beta-lactamase class A